MSLGVVVVGGEEYEVVEGEVVVGGLEVGVVGDGIVVGVVGVVVGGVVVLDLRARHRP